MNTQDKPKPLSAAEITGWQQFWEKNRPTAGFASTINLVWLEEFGDQLFAIIESQRAEILKLERDWDAVREAHDARQAENAQLRERVAKLAAFAHTAIDNAFEGCDMDGGEIQDHLTELGLLIETKYDPMKHGEQDADPGDPWLVVVDWLAKLRGEGDER